MKRTKLISTVAALAATLLLPAFYSLAQQEAPNPPPPGAAAPNVPPPGAPGQGGGDRMEQFRQKMNEMVKTSLKATDEEWSIIQPLLEKVQTKQRETLTSRFSAFGGRRNGGDRGGRPGSPNPASSPAAPNATSSETDALKAALESDSTSPADIKAKLEAVRAARKKAVAELEQAREELRKVLTQRQEASLVMLGLLE